MTSELNFHSRTNSVESAVLPLPSIRKSTDPLKLTVRGHHRMRSQEGVGGLSYIPSPKDTTPYRYQSHMTAESDQEVVTYAADDEV